MLTAAGFQITDVSYERRLYGAYTCVKQSALRVRGKPRAAVHGTAVAHVAPEHAMALRHVNPSRALSPVRPARDAARCRGLGRQQPLRLMPVIDALIAATARVRGLTLVSRNVKDFERAGVPLITFE
jgi:hypothetical protein